MKFYNPQVQLVKKTNKKNEIEYLVHSITFFDETGFEDNGWSIDKTENENIMRLTLKIKRNKRIPIIRDCINPIVHTFNLGVLPFEEGNLDIHLELTNTGKNANGRSNRSTSKGTVSTTGASADIRPLGDKISERILIA